MQKPADYIFDLSPKKLAIYLVLGPLILFFLHTIFTVVVRNLSSDNPALDNGIHIVLVILTLCIAVLVLLWLSWLLSVVWAVEEKQLGLPKKWFRVAYAILLIFIVFNLVASLIEPLMGNESWGEDYRYLIYAPREFINLAGIMVAYPIVCHYAARAATTKRNGTASTFIQALPFTLLLIFGNVLGVPFLHKHFSMRPSSNAQIVKIYVIAIVLFVVIMIIGFIAAITGMV